MLNEILFFQFVVFKNCLTTPQRLSKFCSFEAKCTVIAVCVASIIMISLFCFSESTEKVEKLQIQRAELLKEKEAFKVKNLCFHVIGGFCMTMVMVFRNIVLLLTLCKLVKTQLLINLYDPFCFIIKLSFCITHSLPSGFSLSKLRKNKTGRKNKKRNEKL